MDGDSRVSPTSRPRRVRRVARIAVLLVLMTSACTTTGGQTTNASAVPVATGAPRPIFAIYYMWWDKSHWMSRLGPDYPATQDPLPLPATLDASGCGTTTDYSGNVETDISQAFAYDQSNPQTIVDDVEEAASTGLAGFAVNWIGDGTTTQTPTSSNYNQRLATMVGAVHKVNAEGKPFALILNYQSSAKTLSMDQFTNDLSYFVTTYGDDPAFDHTYSPRPEVIMAGTWKYTDDDIASISQGFRSRLYLLGDEKPSTWDASRADNLDGTSYYWSSQNPYDNPTSFTQLQGFAATIRSTVNPDGGQKTWLAPFTPGYNAQLLYNTTSCVPRKDGQTMHALFDGNLASNPDGWTLISWNEISEGSYVVPLTRYGTQYVDELKTVVQTDQ